MHCKLDVPSRPPFNNAFYQVFFQTMKSVGNISFHCPMALPFFNCYSPEKLFIAILLDISTGSIELSLVIAWAKLAHWHTTYHNMSCSRNCLVNNLIIFSKYKIGSTIFPDSEWNLEMTILASKESIFYKRRVIWNKTDLLLPS